MDPQAFWQVFMETGAPEMYLLYNKARKMEEGHVFNDPGTGSESHGLQ